MLDEKGTPTVTERAWIVPPASQIGPITDGQRATIQKATVSLYGHYNEAIDRDSAYEILKARTETRIEGAGRAGGARGEAGRAGGAGQAGQAGQAGGAGWAGDTLTKILLGSRGPRGGKREGLLEAAAKSAARSVGSGLGRAIIRGTLGSILGSGRSRR